MRLCPWLLLLVVCLGGCTKREPTEPREPTQPRQSRQPEAPSRATPTDAPATVEDELTLVRDAATRTQGLSALERRIPTLTSAAERESFAAAVAATFVEIWDEVAPQRARILRLCLLLAHPGTTPVWTRALQLDGSAAAYEHVSLALEGIEKAKATAATPGLVAALERLIADPRFDQGESAGQVRAAIVQTLGAVGDRRAIPVLITVLEQPSEGQPVVVHRRAASALGLHADPAAVDALLAVIYRVPDTPTTTNIAEQSKIALAAIGEPAVPSVVELLEGRHERINELAQAHGLEPIVLRMAAANFLGAIGSPTAVEPLLRALPTGDCGGRRAAGSRAEDPQAQSQRAVIANALGLIGDERAVEPLCRCATASRNPGDMYPIAEALGRIGGARATRCLARVIETGAYDLDAVGSADFVHEIRWDAARFGLLAAGPDERPIVEAAMRARGQPATVTRNFKAWEPGRALLERCGKDPGCLRETLSDPEADWFAREVAAMTLARRSPGDAALAEDIAQASSVRNPDARVTMAWLAAHMMRGARCPRCAERLRDRLEQERLSSPPKEYQLSVLTTRYSIARLREPAGQ